MENVVVVSTDAYVVGVCHSAAGAGQREEWRAAGHGSNSKFSQASQPAPSLRSDEWRSIAWVSASVLSMLILRLGS